MREAVLSVSDEELAAMGIEGLVEHCRAAGLRSFEELACRGTGAVIQVEVEEVLDGERLRSLASVDRWELVAETGDAYRYVIAFTAPELPDQLAEHADDLVGNCDPDVSERGATMSLVGSQEAIRGTIAGYETTGASPDLRKLGGYEGRADPLDDLTDRQHEVIRTAFDMGYYEVPREVSTADVAAELDVDPSTVAEHLQRAERNLLSRHLAPRE